MKLNIRTSMASMKFLATQGSIGHLAAIGVTDDDFNLVTGSQPWNPSNRQKVYQILGLLMHGSCDVLGVPRFKLPAEFIAGAIALFVHPNNAQQACFLFDLS